MRPASVFLDTGYVIALEAADDQHHEVTLRHWRGLTGALPVMVTTSYVLNEIVTFFNSRNRHAKAVEIGSRLTSSPSVRLVHVDEALFYAGWQYFKQHADKTYSLTDCISFIIMGQMGIQTVLGFDRHFTQAGFARLP